MKFIQIAEHEYGKLGRITARAVSLKYSCVYLDGHKIRVYGCDEPKYMIISQKGYLPVESEENDVLIIAENTDKLKIPPHMANTVIISGEEDLPIPLEYAGSVISCGYGDKCTLTLSQRTDDKCMLSLQREIVTVSGKIVEPREIVVPLTEEISLEKTMLLAAALIYLEADLPLSEQYVKICRASI